MQGGKGQQQHCTLTSDLEGEHGAASTKETTTTNGSPTGRQSQATSTKGADAIWTDHAVNTTAAATATNDQTKVTTGDVTTTCVWWCRAAMENREPSATRSAEAKQNGQPQPTEAAHGGATERTAAMGPDTKQR